MTKFICEDFYVSFGHNNVIQAARLEGHHGEILGLLGLNGCGKSTLFKAMMGLIPGSRGIVRVDGAFIDVRKRSSHFSLLPQQSCLPRDFSVSMAVRLLLPRQRWAAVMSDTRIQAIKNQKCGTLSGGELRYLQFLLVAGLQKPVLLLDEPFAQIEPIYAQLLHEKILHFTKQEGRCVIFTDHNYREIQKTADRILIHRHGSLVQCENTREDLTRYGYIPSLP